MIDNNLTNLVFVINFREPDCGRDALEGLAHYGLGGAGLSGVVQPHHQQVDHLVRPQAAHFALGTLETRGTVASHHFD